MRARAQLSYINKLSLFEYAAAHASPLQSHIETLAKLVKTGSMEEFKSEAEKAVHDKANISTATYEG
jgi:hypothetical protein